jgi:hypothetical protein
VTYSVARPSPFNPRAGKAKEHHTSDIDFDIPGSSGLLKRVEERKEVTRTTKPDGARRMPTAREFEQIRVALLGGATINERVITRSAEDNYLPGGYEAPVERRFHEPMSERDFENIRTAQLIEGRRKQEAEERRRADSRPW